MPVTSPNYYGQQLPEFQPAMRNILSITNANPAVITTTFDGVTPGNHLYQTGLIVRLYIPDGFGMVQANHIDAPITVLNATQFSMPIDTTNFPAYAVPPYFPGFHGTPGMVEPVGEINSILYQATQNVLPYP